MRAREIVGAQASSTSEQLVDSSVLVAPTLPTGAASVVMLINWSARHSVEKLEVTVHAAVPPWKTAEMASGQAVEWKKGNDGKVMFVVSALEDADAIILR